MIRPDKHKMYQMDGHAIGYYGSALVTSHFNMYYNFSDGSYWCVQTQRQMKEQSGSQKFEILYEINLISATIENYNI